MNRRAVLLGFGTLAVAGAEGATAQEQDAAPESSLLLPRIVPAPVGALPEELHVYPDEFALYWVLSDGLALLYACGIGREGLYEAGDFTVGAKKEWPSWTPTPEMIERDPDRYAQWADGMPGGADNPLGARALYLFTPERGDTFLRIHGTNAPQTIGAAVSNGCARLINEHIIDLYDRVPMNTTVYLYPQSGALPA